MSDENNNLAGTKKLNVRLMVRRNKDIKANDTFSRTGFIFLAISACVIIIFLAIMLFLMYFRSKI